MIHTIWYGMIRYDRIFILGRLIHEEERARQVILFGDELALQPCNQVNLLGKHMYQIYRSNINTILFGQDESFERTDTEPCHQVNLLGKHMNWICTYFLWKGWIIWIGPLEIWYWNYLCIKKHCKNCECYPCHSLSDFYRSMYVLYSNKLENPDLLRIGPFQSHKF